MELYFRLIGSDWSIRNSAAASGRWQKAKRSNSNRPQLIHCRRSLLIGTINHLTRFTAFLTSITLIGCASVEPTAPKTELPGAKSLPFQMGRSCFSGARSSYEDWVAAATSANEDADVDTFQMRFPKANYEKYKHALDCNFIAYPVDSLTIRGVYVRPKGREGEDLPVLIVNRGGNGPFGAWSFGRMFHRVLPLASAGYIVIGSQYRGSRRGDDPAVFGSDEFGGEDINDVMALFDLIDQLPGADKNRIGMYGWSRSGFMALIAATMTDRLKAMAVGGTPTDMEAELKIRPEMERVFRARIPGYNENKHAALEARSAVHWTETIDTDLPILILHGENDDRVSLNSSLTLAEILRSQRHKHKLVTYKGGSHGLLERNNEVVAELVTWFGAYLAEDNRRH